MKTDNPLLPLGYSDMPAGTIATVVTCLEMRERPQLPLVEADNALTLRHWHQPDLGEYRELFRNIGAQWLWSGRLVMSDEKLSSILNDPRVAVYILKDAGRRIGLLELDFRSDHECELAYFGLVEDSVGKGAGRFLMSHAIEKAWARPIDRFWVHTCHLDSPAALPFYKRMGFTPYKIMVEVLDDPRRSGIVPSTAAPQVPLIDL
ncbi:GNAT family N-acetyltransferase [Neorhizobium sp. JUb45]|uniref:GNAT family N-acetyltransferase n=1 Tax=unclassified Neorhizobium TaxID=2629175 RepID=UPI0010464025|nr:GNAT family N-acetyltransferase [Neorhizobium sp. JUb45]TCR07172.1 ribosomal protein S18 acetylase RimI-like enzyme [Neorhizobium sp. JUb45]